MKLLSTPKSCSSCKILRIKWFNITKHLTIADFCSKIVCFPQYLISFIILSLCSSDPPRCFKPQREPTPNKHGNLTSISNILDLELVNGQEVSGLYQDAWKRFWRNPLKPSSPYMWGSTCCFWHMNTPLHLLSLSPLKLPEYLAALFLPYIHDSWLVLMHARPDHVSYRFPTRCPHTRIYATPSCRKITNGMSYAALPPARAYVIGSKLFKWSSTVCLLYLTRVE